MSIEFTQFLCPKGKKRTVFIDRSEAVEDLADELVSIGYEFTIEELTIGLVSMTVSKENNDFVHILSQNGPEITRNIDKLVKRAAKELL